MEETVLKTKQEIINALREDIKILQIYFSSVYRARIDPCKKRVGVNEFKSLLETYHNKIEGSDYLYSAIKLCLNEFDYIRKNLRRHGEEYLVGIKWYIGLGIYFGLLIVIMIVDLYFRPKELVEKKIKESKERLGLSAKGGLEEQLENMLGNHMSGYDHAEVRITGSSTAQINVTIYYRHEVHSRQNWYRNDVMHWIKSYLNSHNTGYNSYEIHVNFSNNF